MWEALASSQVTMKLTSRLACRRLCRPLAELHMDSWLGMHSWEAALWRIYFIHIFDRAFLSIKD